MVVFSGICKKVSPKSKAKLKAACYICRPEIQKLMNDIFFKKILILRKRKLGTNLAWWLKTFYATVDHLHLLASSKTFYQVTKISGRECH